MNPLRSLDDCDALPLFHCVRDGDPDTSHTVAAEAVAMGVVDRHERMIAAGLRSGHDEAEYRICELDRRHVAVGGVG